MILILSKAPTFGEEKGLDAKGLLSFSGLATSISRAHKLLQRLKLTGTETSDFRKKAMWS